MGFPAGQSLLPSWSHVQKYPQMPMNSWLWTSSSGAVLQSLEHKAFAGALLDHKINPFLITVPQDSAGPSPSTRCRQRTGSWCQSVPRGLGAPREDWVYVRFTGTASCWLQVLRECWAGFSPSLLWSTAAWSRQIWNCPLTYHQECSLLEAFT